MYGNVFLSLQRLRNENKLLKKRNELLEAESAELADRLVRGQVSRAEEEETSFAIQTELSGLRRAHLEIAHQLDTAHEEIRGLSLRLQENVSSETVFMTKMMIDDDLDLLLYLIVTRQPPQQQQDISIDSVSEKNPKKDVSLVFWIRHPASLVDLI